MQQAQLALSTKNLTKEQMNQVLVQAGLIASEDQIQAELVQSALAQSSLSAEKQKAILIGTGLINRRTGEIITTKACTKEELLNVLATKGVTGANAEAIISALGLTGANEGLSFSFEVLAGSIKQTMLAMAMNPMTWIMAIPAIIYGAVKAYDALTTSTEEIKEAAEEAKSAIDTIKSDFDSLTSTTNDIKERFAELAQEIENLGKINQSRGTLSTDEYDEFLNLSNQLAELFPQLTNGYDDNGNAILDLAGNVDTIVGSLDNLVSVQQNLTNQEILEEMPDVWAGYTTNLDEYTEELDNVQKKVDGTTEALKKLSEKNTFSSKNPSTNNAIKTALGNIGVGSWYNDYKGTFDYNRKSGYTSWDFSSLTESQIEQLKNELGSLSSEYEDAVQLTKGKIETANSEMSSYINTWLSTDAGAKWNFSQMDSDMQNVVEDVLINSDWVSQLPNDVNSGNWDEVSNWLQQKFLYAINTIDSVKIHDSLIDAFNNSLSVEELQELIRQLTQMEEFNEDNPLNVYLNEDVEELQEQFEEVIGKYGEEGKSVIEEFFNDNSIDSSDEIDYWNEITEGAKSAEEAIVMYNEAIAEATDTSLLSFSEAFNASEFANTKEELLNLAKSGELTASVLESNKEYKTLLDDTGLSAEQAKYKILDMLSATEKLSSASQEMDSLSTAYSEWQDKGFVTASTLDSISDVFKGLDGYDLFSQIIGNPTSGKEKIKQAFNDIATEYIKKQATLGNLTEENKQMYIANLEEMGVTNAEEVLNEYVADRETINQFLEDYAANMNVMGEADAEYLKNLTDDNIELLNAMTSLTKPTMIIG